MLLDYSFRKSFLISNGPLKPDDHPIQQLLPPQIPSSSLVRTYSFSQLNNHSNNNNVVHGSNNFMVNNNSKKNLLAVNNNSMNNPDINIHNESSSFNEPYSDISLQLPTINKHNASLSATNIKRIEQLQAKAQQLINQLRLEKQNNSQLKEQNKKLRQDYDSLFKIHNLKQKDSVVKEEKKQLLTKINQYEEQLTIIKKELGQKTEQLVVYEMRSEESRKLLQKLNQNINKKEAKLIKDKEIVTLQLQHVKGLLQEAKEKQRQKDQQILELEQRYKRSIQESLSTSNEVSQRQKNIIVTEYEFRLKQKVAEINQLMDKFNVIENEHREEINRLRQCLSEHESSKTEMSDGLIKLQQDHDCKQQEIEKLEEVIAKLEEKNAKLRDQMEHMVQEFEEQALQHQAEKASQKAKLQKLQLHFANTQFLIKQSEQKNSYLQEQNQRINQLVNELKEDKRMLQRQKEQMKTIINEKTSIIDQLKLKMQQSREAEIKYKLIIENYEKEQQRVYEHENEQANTIAMLQVKIKAQNIDIEKLNLSVSQRQSEVNQANFNCDKFKKMYQQEKLMLAMYKEETTKVRERTQSKWNELKHYYETEIELLQEKIKELESNFSSSQSRARIRNIVQNSDGRARIVSSRILTGKTPQKHNEREQTYINQIAILSIERENHSRKDFVLKDKKRSLQQYKVSDENDEELKENYWHGLNNDSVDHEDQQISKN